MFGHIFIHTIYIILYTRGPGRVPRLLCSREGTALRIGFKLKTQKIIKKDLIIFLSRDRSY